MGAKGGEGAEMIEVKNVSHAYRSGDQVTCALRDLSFSVGPGEIIAITGPSGSGKSTLLNIMGCLLTPDSGVVSLMNRRIDALDDTQRAALRRRHLGFIFQSFNLIPVLDALENVEYPLILCGVEAKQRRRLAEKMLERVGLSHQRKCRPDQISGGQKQRVAIARALIASPGFVLADEPTASLDSHTAKDVLALMSELNREMNTAFIFATHDPRVSSFAHQTYHLEDGVLK